jgi:hypothetical protein
MIRRALELVRERHGRNGVLARDDEFSFQELRYMAEHGFLERKSPQTAISRLWVSRVATSFYAGIWSC